MGKGTQKKKHEYPATEGIEVYNSETLDKEMRNKILDLLEEAYAMSFLMIHLTDGRTGEIIRTYQEMTLNLILDADGWVTVIRSDTGEIAGVAFWLPPDIEYSTWKALSFMPVILKTFGLKCFLRALWIFILIETASSKAEKTFKGKKRIYLANIAVREKYQKKGFARILLKPILKLADREGYVVYLEADGIDNNHIYSRYGFKVLGMIGGGDYFSMARFPK